MTANGAVTIDNRPGEAFKPVTLSSMHIATDTWDTNAALIGTSVLSLPAGGWIAQPPLTAPQLGLRARAVRG
jgi:hypothetical protein